LKEAVMELRLVMEGASAKEIRRGDEAAVAVLEKEQMHPLRAADGYWKLQGWDDRGFPEGGISDEMMLPRVCGSTPKWPRSRRQIETGRKNCASTARSNSYSRRKRRAVCRRHRRR
jgi:hypothetical protein